MKLRSRSESTFGRAGMGTTAQLAIVLQFSVCAALLAWRRRDHSMTIGGFCPTNSDLRRFEVKLAIEPLGGEFPDSPKNWGIGNARVK
jgi:hypothetical protein